MSDSHKPNNFVIHCLHLLKYIRIIAVMCEYCAQRSTSHVQTWIAVTGEGVCGTRVQHILVMQVLHELRSAPNFSMVPSSKTLQNPMVLL